MSSERFQQFLVELHDGVIAARNEMVSEEVDRLIREDDAYTRFQYLLVFHEDRAKALKTYLCASVLSGLQLGMRGETDEVSVNTKATWVIEHYCKDEDRGDPLVQEFTVMTIQRGIDFRARLISEDK